MKYALRPAPACRPLDPRSAASPLQSFGRRLLGPVCPALALVVALLLSAPPAQAQTVYVVNVFQDLPDADPSDGVCDVDLAMPGLQCSLRAALFNANLTGGWVIIQIPAGTYPLTHWGIGTDRGDLDVHSAGLTRLDILGAGPGQTTIDALGLSQAGAPERVLYVHDTGNPQLAVNLGELRLANGRAFALNQGHGGAIRHSGGTLTLTNVVVQDSQAVHDGGGIWSEGNVELRMIGSTLLGNSAPTFGEGGGVRLDNGARLIASTSEFLGNQASERGGGIYVAGGTLAELNNCTVGSNSAGSGGGIYNRGTLVATGTSFAQNTTAAGGSGGGIATHLGSSTTTLRACTVSDNQASSGGGINNSGDLTLDQSRVRGNTAAAGGGVNNTAAGTLALRRSTVDGNTATGALGGGGIASVGRVEAINSTLSGNRSTGGEGGGLLFSGGLHPLELSACTIAFNEANTVGGGIYIDGQLGNTPLSITGVLLSANRVGPFPANFAGWYPLSSAGYNLDEDGTAMLMGPGDQSNVPANLGPLQNNGGPTPTHELQPGSFALAAGTCIDLAGNPIPFDQRGVARTTPCDVGAFQASSHPSPPNDDCANAQPVVPGLHSFDNCGATTGGPAEPCGFTGLPMLDTDVWFHFVLPTDGALIVHLDPAPFEQVLAVYNACPAAGGVSLGCTVAPFFGGSVLVVEGIAGEERLIRVGGRNGQCGLGTLELAFVATLGKPTCFSPAAGPCPCSNAGALGEGCYNSTGLGAQLTASGGTSTVPDILEFLVTGIPAGQPALLFVGTVPGGSLPVGDGLLCVTANVRRFDVRAASPAGEVGWGPGLRAVGGWNAGDVRSFQVWYRDSFGPCGNASNLSSALEVTFH